ncbi:MAG: restriction endonuclease subunit S, partial [bacterium]
MTTLGDLAIEGGIQTGPFGSQLHASDYTEHGVGVVMPQDLGDNIVRPDAMARVPSETAAELSRHRLRPGDIVFSRRGDVTRRSLIRESDGELICGTGCLRVRLDLGKADPIFVSYALALQESQDWLIRHAVGATMPNLNTGILSELPVRTPRLQVQRAVGEVLGALDDKIAANNRDGAIGMDLLHAKYRATTKWRGGENFDDLALVGGGATPSTKKPELWGQGVLWATPTDVTALDGVWLDRTERTISPAGLDSISSPLYPVGSIAMTSRATIGACALLGESMAVNQGFIVLQPKQELRQYWLYCRLLDRVEEFKAWANGATFLELPKKIFRQLPVDLGSESDMDEFA